MPADRNSTPREALLVLALTAVGAILRLWSADRLGLSQYDEGVYAQSGLWVYGDARFDEAGAAVMAFAPPGFTVLVGLAYLIALQPSDGAAIAVSQVCGILTIPVVAWLGRRTFGPGAGAASAAFAALSGPHVAYSRMALTDTPLLLAWLLAMGLGQRFLERPGVRRALALGVAVGVAQNFKYSGWIAGVIVATGAVLGLFSGRREAGRAIAFGGIAAILALLVYLPWFLFVEAHGGYARLIAHHQTYVGGWSLWWPHWKLQMAQSVALSGGPKWAIAAWASAWASGRFIGGPHPGGVREMIVPGLLIGAASGLLLTNLSWWIGLGALPIILRAGRPAWTLLATWWLTLTFLTPFYHPYARLWLPIHAIGWLALGGLAVNLASARATGAAPRKSRLGAGLVVGVVGGLLLTFTAGRRAAPLPGLLGPSDGLRKIVDQEVLPAMGRSGGATIRTFARPVLYFYLSRRALVAPMERPEGAIPPPHSGDYGLIDEAMIPLQREREDLRRRLLQAPAANRRFLIDVPPATLLDIEPDRAYDPTPGEARALWFLDPSRHVR